MSRVTYETSALADDPRELLGPPYRGLCALDVLARFIDEAEANIDAKGTLMPEHLFAHTCQASFERDDLRAKLDAAEATRVSLRAMLDEEQALLTQIMVAANEAGIAEDANEEDLPDFLRRLERQRREDAAGAVALMNRCLARAEAADAKLDAAIATAERLSERAERAEASSAGFEELRRLAWLERENMRIRAENAEEGSGWLRARLDRYGQHEAGCNHVVKPHYISQSDTDGGHLGGRAMCAADPARIRACCDCGLAESQHG